MGAGRKAVLMLHYLAYSKISFSFLHKEGQQGSVKQLLTGVQYSTMG